jgi:hypothetical protein
MKEAHFITLTVPSVKKETLKSTLVQMQSNLKGIQEVMRKRGTPLIGIRKLECNHNLSADTFNPHFHLIIEGEYESYVLLDEWLKRNPECSPSAQHLRQSKPDDLHETFKYTTKLVTKEESNGKTNKKPISPQALHEILKAFRNVRTFQNIGNFGKVNTEENDDNIDTKKTDNYTHVPLAFNKIEWIWTDHDWINKGNYLSDYKPSEAIEQFRNKTKQCNAINAGQISPQKTINTNTVQRLVEQAHFIPVKEAHKRPNTERKPTQQTTLIE